MYKKTIQMLFILSILIAIIPLVSSAPPFVTSDLTSGYALKFPDDTVLKQNENVSFEFHVYNISNGVPIITGISCEFHLYDGTGEHLLKLIDTTPSETWDYSFAVHGQNFSSVGDYYYLTQCNSTSLGGYVQVPIQVTPNGIEITTGRAFIDIGLLIVLLVFLIGAVVIFMEGEHLLVKVGMLGLGYLILMAITFIAWNMATDFLLSAPFVASMFRILFFVLVIGFFPLIIGAFAWYIIMATKVKEINRLIEKGWSYDDANRRQGRKFK